MFLPNTSILAKRMRINEFIMYVLWNESERRTQVFTFALVGWQTDTPQRIHVHVWEAINHVLYHNHRLGSWAKPKIMNASYPRLKVAFRTKGKVYTNADVILMWIWDSYPGLNTEYWRVLDRLPKAKDQRLPLLIHRASFKTIRKPPLRYSQDSLSRVLRSWMIL